MALPVASPIAAQVMVSVFGVQWLISRQGNENGPQVTVQRRPMLPLGFAFVVALEG